MNRCACAARQRAWGLLVLSAALLHLMPLCARAQYSVALPRGSGGQGEARSGWEFQPTLSVEEVYTDNVRLSPKGSERSDWVTQVRPGFTLRTDRPGLLVDLSYTPELVYRAREGTHDVYNYLRGRGTAEVVDELLFVDARVHMSRENASLFGPQAQSDVNVTGNRTSVRGYDVSPYLRRSFGLQSTAELRYSHSVVEYSGGNLYNSEADRLEASLASGPAYRLLTWDVRYLKDHIRYTDTNQNIDMERISAGGRRLITPNVGVLMNAGYEDNNYLTTGPKPRGKFWSVGPEWTPTPRTRIAATTGRHFFGQTRTLDFSHRTRLSTWTVKYDEDLTTSREEVFVPTGFDTASAIDALLLPRIPDAAARQEATRSLISQTGLPATFTQPVNFLTTVPFVQKRLDAGFAIDGVRNTVFTNIYRQSRDRTAADAALVESGGGDLALSARTVQKGVTVLWSLRVTPVTTSNFTVDVVRNEFPTIGREDEITSVRLALVKRFHPRVSGTVALRRLQNSSNESAAEYTENAVAVGVHLSF